MNRFLSSLRSSALVFLLMMFFISAGNAQTVEFADEFENGTLNWVLNGNWGTSTASFTGLYCLTESPNGNYWNMETSTATMQNGVDLSLATDAYVEFAAQYYLEYSFDYVYVEATYNNGLNWIPVATFTGDSAWWRYSFSIGGFVGYPNVKVRFRFNSDQALNYDGFSVDNFQITSYEEDITPPMILHNGPIHYEGVPDTFYVQASILDISGVASAELHYWVDTVYQGVVQGNQYFGTQWLFTIPPVSAGAWVDYYLIASDSAPSVNTDTSDLFQYIAGNTIKYDNGHVDFVQIVGQTSAISGAAVKMDLNGLTTIVSGLIRTYTDPFIVNGPIQFHIWADNNGVPGNDLITPFLFTPEANASAPHKMTRLDLRPYADSLVGISGSVFAGFTSPGSQHYTPITSPGSGGHSYYYNGISWAPGQADLHFRIVTTDINGAPEADFTFNDQNDPQVSFTDSSSGNPINWIWDFGDGTILSQVQNPGYVFTENGVYLVCLTAINTISSSTHCELVEISNCLPPIAGFSFNLSYTPEVLFQDLSLHYPTSWHWDFDDNGNTWNYLNPIYTFSKNDTFNVCLKVENAYGSDSICQAIVIDAYTGPSAAFSYSDQQSPLIQFFDESSSQIINSPDLWEWNFGDGSPLSYEQNPQHLFPDNGVYTVCLTVTNAYGSSLWCAQVVINSYTAPEADFTWSAVASPWIDFLDSSSDSVHNIPTQWNWQFGDGGSSSLQNPSHTFSQNGTYTVCLIATNSYGSDTICQDVVIDSYQVPTAAFTFNTGFAPMVFFVDYSLGTPTEWEWNFGDGTANQINQNPVHTFSTNGPFQVCLVVSNYLGSDSICQPITLNYYTSPVSKFTWQAENGKIVYFQDQSTMNPTSWYWAFGDGTASSSEENPTYTYPETGDYVVCLTAGNFLGTGTVFCDTVTAIHDDIFIDQPEAERIIVYPNPVQENAYLLYPEEIKIEQLHIRDESGRIISSNYQITASGIVFPMAGLTSGIYFLEVLTPLETYRIKLIKL